MKNNRIILFFLGGVFVWNSYFTFKFSPANPSLFWIFYILPLFIISTPYLLIVKKIYIRFIYILVSIISNISLAIYVVHFDFRLYEVISEKFILTIFVFSYLILFLFFIVVLPVFLFPYFFNKQKKPSLKNRIILDLTSLDESINLINNNFTTLQSEIEKQRPGIEKAVKDIEIGLEKQKKELAKVSNKLMDRQLQLSEFEEIAKLSEPQIDAIFNTLNKNKHIEYIIGFILGIIGSGLVQSIPYIYELLN